MDRLFELAPLLAAHMEAGLSERGLTSARSVVLWQLHRAGPMIQRELSRSLRMSARNVTALVDGLESAGLVTRRIDPADRRVRRVALTGDGRSAADRMAKEREGFADWLFAGADRHELRGAVAALDLALERLRAVPGPGSELPSEPSGAVS